MAFFVSDTRLVARFNSFDSIRSKRATETIIATKDTSVKKYVVRLSGEEREQLESLKRKGRSGYLERPRT